MVSRAKLAIERQVEFESLKKEEKVVDQPWLEGLVNVTNLYLTTLFTFFEFEEHINKY